MIKANLYSFPMAHPGDVSGLEDLVNGGRVNPEHTVAIMAKTEGNGRVNDFTRGFAAFAFASYLGAELGLTREEVVRRVVTVMSGGCEGVMTPHAIIFTREEVDGAPDDAKRLTIGTAFTRRLRPEELGRRAQMEVVAEGVRAAMENARIEDVADIHFVQVKGQLLTASDIQDAVRAGETVCTEDTTDSMYYSAGACALGVAMALGEVPADRLTDDVVLRDFDLWSGVASASVGGEMQKCDIMVLGNSSQACSDLTIGHAVMADSLDVQAVLEALRSAGLRFEAWPDQAALQRLVHIFAKAGIGPDGLVRGRRTTVLSDSDFGTRPMRAVVNAVIASVTGDPMIYVSGGKAPHSGPAGGGPIAAVVCTAD